MAPSRAELEIATQTDSVNEKRPVLSTQTSKSSGIGSDLSDHSSSDDDDVAVASLAVTSFVGKFHRKWKEMFPSEKLNKSTQTASDPIQVESERLARDVIFHLLSKKHLVHDDQVSECLRNCVEKLLEKHSILFTGMVKRLKITPQTGYQTFYGVADELFEDGNVTWGRIVALYAFGGRLAVYCKNEHMENYVVDVAQFMGRYMAEKLGGFINSAGGWSKLCEEFPKDEDVAGKVWKCLLVTGVGLGLAATLLATHS